MSLTGSALEIGKSALLAYQSALQVVGNNVSNAGSTSYTRQTPILSPTAGAPLPEGFTPGGGVTLSALKRNIDSALENRLRIASGDQNSTQVQQDTLGRIEGIMNELSDSDLSSLLSAMFNSFSSLQNTPQDGSARGVTLTAVNSVTNELQRQRSAVLELNGEANTNLADAAKQSDKLLHDIADLNVQITSVESSQAGGANSLRDQRDDLLRQLGDLMQVQVREQDDGGDNVYVGNELLVQGGYTRGITSTTDTQNGYPTTVVRFADNNGQVTLQGGKMAGLIAARDTDVMGQINNLDQLAAALINEINKVHAQGQGTQGFTSVNSANNVLDSTASLSSDAAGLALRPQNGSFQLTVTDRSGGTSIATNIKVDLTGAGSDDSLASLAAKINSQVSNVTATVTPDNHLKLTAANGFAMTFGQDSSNVLASLGINTLLTGHDASDIAVNSVITGNPQLLATGTSSSAGDGSNAGALAALATTSLDSLGGRSITQTYDDLVANVANKGAAAKSSSTATQSIYSALSSQRESIGGVNLDEETISLMKLERSFQGAARFVSVVDSLLQEMISIVK